LIGVANHVEMYGLPLDGKKKKKVITKNFFFSHTRKIRSN